MVISDRAYTSTNAPWSSTTGRQLTPASRSNLDPDLVQAFTVLGLTPSATWEEITAVHRNLLKKHHPDRHAGHEGNMRKATAQSQKIGEAYQKIKKHLGR